jgi:hypothetical protein
MSTTASGQNPVPLRGLSPTPRHVLVTAPQFIPRLGAPPNGIIIPRQISAWGNVSYPAQGIQGHGDCVTAEEAFAKACNNPEIFISDNEVIQWATQHGVLEGANCATVLRYMQSDGFRQSGSVYDDGAYSTINWTDPPALQSALTEGPVKLGVSSSALGNAWANHGYKTGWFGIGFQPDSSFDHCVSLCGYGTLTWLAQQLQTQVPAGVDGNVMGYAMFTWNSIGIVDHSSMVAITCEAWLRRPTTVAQPALEGAPAGTFGGW